MKQVVSRAAELTITGGNQAQPESHRITGGNQAHHLLGVLGRVFAGQDDLCGPFHPQELSLFLRLVRRKDLPSELGVSKGLFLKFTG